MKLAPPGSGLPDFERLLIKYVLVPAVRIFITWDIALFLLKREVTIIKNLVEKLDEEQRTEQVIIDRSFGIEDDSRRYSVSMALDHLTIVASAAIPLITTLSNEQKFPGELSIENVKPNVNRKEQLNDFLKINERYDAFIRSLPKKLSVMTQKHPWFVGFNNFDWHVFIYMHTFVHRRQIEAIIKQLGDPHE